MFNKKKLFGLLVALVGVFATKTNPWFEEGSLQAFILKSIGVIIACIGIAFFASGIQNKIEKKIRICPHCFKKNDAENACCRRCKKVLENPSK